MPLKYWTATLVAALGLVLWSSGVAHAARFIGASTIEDSANEERAATPALEVPALSLGTFALAPGLGERMDRAIEIGNWTGMAPGDGSFAHYLRQTLETKLEAAGKLDPNSPIVITGALTRSGVMRLPGRAVLGARFVAVRNGEVIFDKELVVHDQWSAGFIIAKSVPETYRRYTALYSTLATALLNDPEFRSAVRSEPN